MVRKKEKKNINVNDSETTGKLRLKTFNYNLIKALGCFCFLFFFSCNSEENEIAAVNSQEKRVDNEEEDYNSFAKELHKSFVEGNDAFLNSYIGWNTIEKGLAKSSEGELSEQEGEVLEYLKATTNTGADFVQQANGVAYIRFITYYQEDNSHHLIFRVFEEPQDLNFFDFEILSTDKGIVITDIYEYQTCHSLTDLIRDQVKYYGSKDDWKNHFVSNQNQLDSAKNLINDGELANGFKLMSKLEVDYKQSLIYQRLKSAVVRSSGNFDLILKDLYNNSINVPVNEKGRWLGQFYLNAYQDKYQDALIALENLELEVGEDAFIDFLKGNVYFEMGSYTDAILYFNTALSKENDVYTFHKGKVLSFLELGDYEKATESLLVLEDFYDVKTIDWSQELFDYPVYLKSEAFNSFKERL